MYPVSFLLLRRQAAYTGMRRFSDTPTNYYWHPNSDLNTDFFVRSEVSFQLDDRGKISKMDI